MIKKIKAISLKSSNFLIRPTLHWENDWIRILRMSFTKVRMRWSASLATLLLKSSTMKSTQQSISPFSVLRSHLRSKGFHVRYTAIYYPHFKITERCTRLVRLFRLKGRSLSEVIVEIMKDLKLPLINLIGKGFDCASNMSGKGELSLLISINLSLNEA